MLEDEENGLPFESRTLLRELGEELRRLDGRVKRFDQRIDAISLADPACRRLREIPGIGALSARGQA